ncbi:MAG: hypothetical protein HY926_08215 [Elusimicrobia bacterium]|nr:hypothetical protein [Elusimicrobiota bacterium]
MNQCSSCKKEIDDGASKCPYCQAFQQWYRNPQVYGLLILIPVFGFLFLWQRSLMNTKNYIDYQDKFAVEKVSQVVNDDKKWDFLTYKIKNGTDLRWEHLEYQLIGLDEKGAIVYTCSNGEYGWSVQPKAEALITASCGRNKNIAKWDFKITEMTTPWRH